MPNRTRIVSLLTALAVLIPLAVPALAVATEDRDRSATTVCEQMPELPRCQQERQPRDSCERMPEHPRCQEPVDRCEVRPEHPRCQDRVDRCQGETDNHPRCPTKPNYRQLFWRIVKAGEWRMLIRLLIHLGIL